MTATLSEAAAETAALPATVALFNGLEILTVGGVVSGTGLSTLMVTAVEIAVLPAASLATAVRVCAPLIA